MSVSPRATRSALNAHPRPGDADTAIDRFRELFSAHGWSTFDFQEEVWWAMHAGASGLIHAPTGTGKTLAAWLGAILRLTDGGSRPVDTAGLRVVWITPLRALAADTLVALEDPLRGLRPLSEGITVGIRTGDTSAGDRRRLRGNWPTALVTTPETLSILLSLETSHEIFGALDAVIVDEWHELVSTKQGVQTELALSRLRAIRPGLITWGLSAALANLDEATAALVGPATASHSRVVSAAIPRKLDIETLIPDPMERFPWAGHMGMRLVPQVVAAIDHADTSLVFTNTRAQAERWFDAIRKARPDWKARMALHHGSVDRELRSAAEQGLKCGRMKCVVATSSLDLGVDFGPVNQVIQIGSPKGLARLLQRAGRSGHAPGATGRLVCVPTHALELIECAAARGAVERGTVEVKWLRGRRLGTVEESFVSRLKAGDRFLFAGRPLVLVRFDGLTAWVKRSRSPAPLQVPRWNGGKMPLTTLLSDAVLDLVSGNTNQGVAESPELAAVSPLLNVQWRASRRVARCSSVSSSFNGSSTPSTAFAPRTSSLSRRPG